MIRAFLPLAVSLAISGLAAALGGCNETTGSTAPVLSAPIGPTAYRLPPRAGCTGEINRYQDVLRADLETGNVEQKIFNEIQGELTKAASACEAGRDGEARSIVASSKARHGYHA